MKYKDPLTEIAKIIRTWGDFISLLAAIQWADEQIKRLRDLEK